ncbi:hypothetical protein AB1M95_08150 [Sulfitobacter sp. LCG007]
MGDAQPHEGQSGGILLARIGEQVWLIEGEAHLSAMLTTTDGFPTPVHCITPASVDALGALLPEGTELGDLWAIHPAIAARLESDGHLVIATMPDEA